jgi:hypothetical protein
MRNQDESRATFTKIFSLALVFAIFFIFEFQASAMSKDTATLLNDAALEASHELAAMNKDYNAIIRTRLQTDIQMDVEKDLILPQTEENQVASAK